MGVISIEQFKKPKVDEETWIKFQKVCKAICLIHAEGRYYEGMDLLCEVVGWGKLLRGINPPEEMDKWVREQSGVVKEKSVQPDTPVSPTVGKRCPSCKRIVRIVSETRKRKNRKPSCPVCGMRFNKLREKGEV